MPRTGFQSLYSDKHKDKEKLNQLKSEEYKSINTPTEKHTAVSSPSLQSVMIMQDQLLKIYNTFSSSDFFKTAEAKDFFDYLLNKYIKKDNFGKEVDQENVQHYSPGGQLVEKQDHRMVGDKRNLAQSTEEPLDLFKYVSSIQYVGKHVKDGVNKPDGIWGQYTNNALINILSFANTLYKLCKSLNIDSRYNDQDLNQLQQSIPHDFKKIGNKDELAKIIAGNLNKVHQMLSSFIAGILKYKEYIAQNKKFEAGYKDQKKSFEEEKQISQYGNNVIGQIPSNFDSKESNLLSLTVNDVSSKDNFTNFLKNNKVVINNKNSWEDGGAFNSVVDSVSKTLDKVLNPDSGV